jgi:hypothetical protein
MEEKRLSLDNGKLSLQERKLVYSTNLWGLTKLDDDIKMHVKTHVKNLLFDCSEIKATDAELARINAMEQLKQVQKDLADAITEKDKAVNDLKEVNCCKVKAKDAELANTLKELQCSKVCCIE